MIEYQKLLIDVMYRGTATASRAGDTISSFGHQMKFDLSNFPAVTIKKLYFNSVAAELAGFLRAETDASKMGSKIWEKDAERWSGGTDMGRVYGSQWRQWKGPQGRIDQLRQVVETIKWNPNNRRLLVTAWNPGETHLMCLPPCHYAFQFYVIHGTLSCLFVQRSVDMVLGLPFDIASYALLTHIIANECNLAVGELTAQLGNCHVYVNHTEAVDELLSRVPMCPPHLKLDPEATIDNFRPKMAVLQDYIYHPPVAAPLNVG